MSEARVIDLFAGSGALGLEALSRGAAFCVFVDSELAAREAIGANLAALRLTERGRVIAADAKRLPALPDGPFDLAFLDPPYGEGLAEAALGGLRTLLAAGAAVIVERDAAEGALSADGYDRLDERRWGVARVDFLKKL